MQSLKLQFKIGHDSSVEVENLQLAQDESRIRLRKIALEYFDKNPEAKVFMTEKGRALLHEEFRATHHYEYRNGETKCWVCGEKYYPSNGISCCGGFAAKYPREDTSVKGVLRREELLYEETIKRCRSLVKERFKSPQEVTGEALAELYHTHGCDSSIVEEVLDCRLPESVHTAFMMKMDMERARSKSAQKKVIVIART